MARPPKYDPKNNKQVTKLARLGATNKEIADFFEVSGTTVDNWLVQYPEFLGAIKKGRIESDANVSNSLYRRAVGYTVIESTYEKRKVPLDAEGTTIGQMVEVKRVKKHIAPEVLAGIYWLNNRRRNNWTQKPEPEGGDDTPPQVFIIAGQEIHFK